MVHMSKAGRKYIQEYPGNKLKGCLVLGTTYSIGGTKMVPLHFGEVWVWRVACGEVRLVTDGGQGHLSSPFKLNLNFSLFAHILTIMGKAEKEPQKQVKVNFEKGTKRARITSSRVRAEDFADLGFSHPHGLLPGGNRFFADAAANKDKDKDKDPTRLLTDEAWYSVLELCDATDLARLIQTCRYFYVAGSQPELWRDCVLRKQGSKTISTFGGCWKDTYVKINSPASDHHPSRPMPVSGVYSDFFYRLHSCRSFALPKVWFGRDADSIQTVPVDEMTVEIFEEEYEKPNRPVLVEGAASSWKATQKWKDQNYCQNHAGDRSFRATSGGAPLPGNFSLESYYDYCRMDHLEESPLYLFDRTALEPGTPFWNDFMSDLQESCPYWDPNRDAHDLFKLLGEGRRPDHTWMIMGPKRSGSVFHIDPNATHAWNAAILGRKRWFFYPPGVTPPGIHPSEDGDSVALPLSVGEWLFQFFDEHEARKRSAPPAERPFECTALPGDLVFIPHGWWHMVINLDDINCAITHNYASASNLSSVLRFLSEKRDQVSGCRDRADSVKPEQLYEEFVTLLEARHPEWLKEALASDWNCKAWKSPPLKEVQAIEKDPTSQHHDTSIMEKARAGENSAFSFSFL
jgi:hypothetical protein